ncbi:MAG: roadblock/LC7 domain-containing protein [Streptomyces sp.]|uniref:Roadblock/LC7 domain-containing protein n=2 Tax=Streptomyces TaxID=1883 RepID=A0ABV5E7H7_9ACTN|nr:roadblock/LC7 domain-containing protein [Streptomyces sp. B93]MBC7270966.1 roadblock/LC7 domain-containing protein [Streptomyces sp.]MBQ1091114.1 roadblock/LC7 domain-containing protein [Streptomyces sp. B93]
MMEYRRNIDWMLTDLNKGVPGIQMIVVLSADGLRIARQGGDPDTADRVAAACAGLQSLASAISDEIVTSDGEMRMILIEVNGGYFYLMAAGPNAYLAVLSDIRTEPGMMSSRMRDLVARLGPHLTSPPRRNGKVV